MGLGLLGFWPWVLGSFPGCFAERGGQLGCEEGCTDEREEKLGFLALEGCTDEREDKLGFLGLGFRV